MLLAVSHQDVRENSQWTGIWKTEKLLSESGFAGLEHPSYTDSAPLGLNTSAYYKFRYPRNPLFRRIPMRLDED